MRILAIAFFCISLARAICLEESGSANGTGSHIMEIELPGDNLTDEESAFLLAMHGYNVTQTGVVGLNGTTWHVIRCQA
ncbi:hypothetical protein M0R72_07225 [Candidatus Pacearchaeota archaeon]|jgi:hypothetical protein|nr:hypothetical protein [Candidatus Pacearchaeota archaeon]